MQIKFFLSVVIYHCAKQWCRGSRCIERNDSPHILEKQLNNKAQEKNRARQMDDLQSSFLDHVEEFVYEANRSSW